MAAEQESHPDWVFRDLGGHGGGWAAWQSTSGAMPLAGGRSFATVEEAVAWARERADCVLVNVDRDRRCPGGWWTAGRREPDDGERHPPWPPQSYGFRLALEGLPDDVVEHLPPELAAAGLPGAEVQLRHAGPGSVRVSFRLDPPTFSGAEQAGMDAFFPLLDEAWRRSGAPDAPLFFSYAVTPQP